LDTFSAVVESDDHFNADEFVFLGFMYCGELLDEMDFG
jgi:hypothetical protein